MNSRNWATILLALLITVVFCADVFAEGDEDLSKKLANPIASMISIPIQYNYDKNIGLDNDGSVTRVNIQPVIPFSLNSEWNLITRTIFPLIDQEDVPVSGMGESGLGDVVMSFFFSPAAPTSSGLVWGVGPVIMLPTAAEEELGSEKYGIGPTGVVLKQAGQWTFGGLANHIRSVAGDDARDDVNATFIQPFMSYITKTKTTIAFMTESTYDWENEQWSVPVILQVSQLLRIGKLPVQIGVGVKYWAESSEFGPEDWGARAQLTVLLPK